MASKPMPPFIQGGNPFRQNDTVEALVARGMSKRVLNKREGRMYASDAGFCERQAALNAVADQVESQSAASTVYYALGSRIEDLVLDALYTQGSLLFKQYRLPDVGLNLGGYIDGIIAVAGRIRALEVKSCGALPTSPKGPHVSQALVYSAITGLPTSLLYFSRNVANFWGELMIREFELDEAIDEKRAALFRAVYASLSIRDGVVPDKPYHITSESACGFCRFTNICWGVDSLPKGSVPITPRQAAALTDEANAAVDILMAPENVASRRNGILSHISRAGNENAQALLAGKNWRDLI